jgi:hypothetical protein
MNIWERIQSLEDPRHRKGLEWFIRHSGKVMNVPRQMEDGTNLHFPTGGGMFKPSKSNYVLSVRSSHRANLESLYADPEPQKTETGWRYKYQQVITIGGPKWKNNGMQSNIDDAVPVGVFRNTGGKSGGITMYEVLGVAYVRSYDETTGYFELEYSPAIISDIDIDSAKSNLEEDLRLWRDTQQVIREGQAKFRNDLIEVYAGKCAITGYDVELALDAAHVRKYNGKHTNIVQNGLLLRKDLHKLFDHGVFGIRPGDLSVVLNDRARNTRYAELANVRLRLPSNQRVGPDPGLLAEHLKTWKLS